MTKKLGLLILVLSLILSLAFVTGCKEKEETSEKLMVTSGELYSKDGVDGIILDGMVYFQDLGVSKKRITEYGFIYTFEDLDSFNLDTKGVKVVTLDDVVNSNHLTKVIDVEKENYNKDLIFRMYIKYMEDYNDPKSDIKTMYSVDYGACNLYELAKNDPCDYAKSIVSAVENK